MYSMHFTKLRRGALDIFSRSEDLYHLSVMRRGIRYYGSKPSWWLFHSRGVYERLTGRRIRYGDGVRPERQGSNSETEPEDPAHKAEAMAERVFQERMEEVEALDGMRGVLPSVADVLFASGELPEVAFASEPSKSQSAEEWSEGERQRHQEWRRRIKSGGVLLSNEETRNALEVLRAIDRRKMEKGGADRRKGGWPEGTKPIERLAAVIFRYMEEVKGGGPFKTMKALIEEAEVSRSSGYEQPGFDNLRKVKKAAEQDVKNRRALLRPTSEFVPHRGSDIADPRDRGPADSSRGVPLPPETSRERRIDDDEWKS